MEVKSHKSNDGYYTYVFKKDNDEIQITFLNNLDLYWSYRNINSSDEINYGQFVIGKEDGLPYQLLEELYESIANADPFDVYANLAVNHFLVSRLSIDWDKYDMYRQLFDGDKITWISDDRDLETDSLVQISKKDDAFVLEFAKKEKDKDIHWYTSPSKHRISVRFRNSGSHYDPFNVVFMKMYNSLSGYSTEFGQLPSNRLNEIPGQISMEEYVYSLKK